MINNQIYIRSLQVDTRTCVLKVPETSVDLYKMASQWENFQNIVGLSDEEIAGVEGLKADNSGIVGKTFNLRGEEVGSE